MLIFMTHISGKNRTSHTSRNEHCVTTKQALVGPSLHCRPFWKEFRMVGQICREGMQGWQWYPTESTICNDRISLPGAAGVCGGCYKPSSGSRAEPWWGSQGQSPRKLQRLCSTQYQKMPPKSHFLGKFLSVCCIQIERKNSFKLKEFVCKANNSTSCSVNISKRISWQH